MCLGWSGLVIRMDDENTLAVARCCMYEQYYPIKLNDFLKMDLNHIGELAKNAKFYNKPAICDSVCIFSDTIKDVYLNIICNCNLRCYHCCAGFDYQSDNPFCNCGHKSAEELLKRKKCFFDLLYFLKGKHLEAINLDGSGEIFLYYKELIPWLMSLSQDDFKEIHFTTNGTLLDRKKLNLLKKISKKTGVEYRINISIDGITKETFETIRRGANFEHTLEILSTIKELFGNNFYVFFTIKKPNIKEVDQVKNFFKDYNLYWSVDRFDPECAKYLKEADKWDH